MKTKSRAGRISSKDCKPGTVMVYDSLQSGDLPPSVKEVIAALVKCEKKIFQMCSNNPTHQAVNCLLWRMLTLYVKEKIQPRLSMTFLLCELTFFIVFRNKSSQHFPEPLQCTIQLSHYQQVSESTVFVAYQIGATRWFVAIDVKSGFISCVWTWM